MKDSESNIQDMTCNHQCSRCGSCCGLFIPFTQKELELLKEYVKKNNIQPINRIDDAQNFKAHCCFFDEQNHKCNVYEVRPYACRDFKCDRKNWKDKRISYEKRAKYNSTETKNTIMATFDDLIYEDYYPILRYLISLVPHDKNGIESKYIIELLEQVNRLDLLKHLIAYDENGNKIDGINLKNK